MHTIPRVKSSDSYYRLEHLVTTDLYDALVQAGISQFLCNLIVDVTMVLIKRSYSK